MAPDEARREALRQFGDLEATRHYCRQQDEDRENEMQRGLLFQDFMQDLRIGIRSLLRAPVLTLTIVVTVGLGLGATAAIFSAVSAALLRPLPYAEPEDLVRIYTDTPPFKFRFSVVDYLAFTEQQTRFEQHATYTDRAVSFNNGDTAELLRTRVVSWGFFSVLGIPPMIGRDFTEADGKPGTPAGRHRQPHVLAASGSVAAPTRSASRSGSTAPSTRSIGVMPPAAGPLERRFDLFLIQQFTPPPTQGSVLLFGDRAAAARAPIARWPPSELHAINRALFPIWKSSYQDDKATWNMEDLKTNLVGNVGTLAGLALAAVGLVWLIACANASNLLIARVTSRRQELAVRAALGASRGRVLALPARRKRGARHRRSRARRWRRVGRDAAVAGAGRRLLSAHAGDPFRCADDAG